jgi:hypothetical protein
MKKLLIFLLLLTNVIIAQEAPRFRCSKHGKMQVIRVGEEPSGIKKQKTKDDFAKTSAAVIHVNLTGEDLRRHAGNLINLERALSYFRLLNWNLGPRGESRLRSYSNFIQQSLRNPDIVETLSKIHYQNIIDAELLAERAEQLKLEACSP